MRILTIIRADIKRHIGVLFGIALLLFMTAVSFATVATVFTNSRSYITREMQRTGYGDLTLWVTGVPDMEQLRDQIETLDPVRRVTIQPVVIANYELNHQESDSEGQLITCLQQEFPYRFFSDDLSSYIHAPDYIDSGHIYVPASFVSMFGAKTGDTIQVVAARNGVTMKFVISGFFEDPFMGSSMIGMKSMLVSESDREQVVSLAQKTGIDSLARDGAMIHITQDPGSPLSASELNSLINERTAVSAYTESTHSKEVLAGFMLILQNVFSGILLAFVLVLLVITGIVLAHTIASTIEQDSADIRILKTVGYTSGNLRFMQTVRYGLFVAVGLLAGFAVSPAAAAFLNRMTLPSTGVLIPARIPVIICSAVFIGLLLLLMLFIMWRTKTVLRIRPLDETGTAPYTGRLRVSLKKTHLSFRLALRQLLTGKKNYIGACLIAVLLVFFASMVGRLNAWLGPNGEGLMDAFNPADLDLGVQIFSDMSRDDIESEIERFSPITDHYALAMPTVALNGVDYTANVITDPSRFHILKGTTCRTDTDVVLTEFLAKDLDVSIGDSVRLSANAGSASYTVTGFYQCANDLGANFGLSREGYLKIARDDSRLWCTHYFLKDSSVRKTVMHELEQRYGADVHVHENAWPGLYGIISAMRSLMIIMYVVVAVFILTAVSMNGSKLLNSEQHDLSLYRVLGFPLRKLRLSFALRFGLVSAAGSLVGILLSAVFTDPVVDQLLRLYGISGFSSHPGPVAFLFPPVAVILLFFIFAWFVSGKVRKQQLNTLIAE